MSAPVTEAHRAITESVCELLDSEEMVGPSPAERAAQLIADSEAKACAELRGALALGQQNCDDVFEDLRTERDQLRAERDKLLGYYHEIVAELGDDLALKCIRDLRAEVERLKTCNQHLDRENARMLDCSCIETLARAEKAEREVERLKATPQTLENAVRWEDCERMRARAERAEAEVKKLTGFYNEIVVECGHDRIVREYRQRGELLRDEANRRKEAEAELADIRALANRRNKRDHSQDTTHQLVAALDQALDIAQAELATERARIADLVADLNDACITLTSAEEDCDDYAMQNTRFKLTAVREVLLQHVPNAAIKEGAK